MRKVAPSLKCCFAFYCGTLGEGDELISTRPSMSMETTAWLGNPECTLHIGNLYLEWAIVELCFFVAVLSVFGCINIILSACRRRYRDTEVDDGKVLRSPSNF